MGDNEERVLLSVSEFLRLTRLSADETLAMLGSGELAFERVDGKLQIDISKVTPESLANRAAAAAEPNHEQLALIEEVVASELVAALDTIVDEALDLALRWQRAASTAAQNPSRAEEDTSGEPESIVKRSAS